MQVRFPLAPWNRSMSASVAPQVPLAGVPLSTSDAFVPVVDCPAAPLATRTSQAASVAVIGSTETVNPCAMPLPESMHQAALVPELDAAAQSNKAPAVPSVVPCVLPLGGLPAAARAVAPPAALAAEHVAAPPSPLAKPTSELEINSTRTVSSAKDVDCMASLEHALAMDLWLNNCMRSSNALEPAKVKNSSSSQSNTKENKQSNHLPVCSISQRTNSNPCKDGSSIGVIEKAPLLTHCDEGNGPPKYRRLSSEQNLLEASCDEETIDEAWVELTSKTGTTYYWNRQSNIISFTPPAGVKVKWVGTRTTSGCTYFWSRYDENEVVWVLPPLGQGSATRTRPNSIQSETSEKSSGAKQSSDTKLEHHAIRSEISQKATCDKGSCETTSGQSLLGSEIRATTVIGGEPSETTPGQHSPAVIGRETSDTTSGQHSTRSDANKTSVIGKKTTDIASGEQASGITSGQHSLASENGKAVGGDKLTDTTSMQHRTTECCSGKERSYVSEAPKEEQLLSFDEEWVELTSKGGKMYFWNRRDGASTFQSPLPVGVKAKWVAQRSSGGKTYYWSRVTKDAVWVLPPVVDLPATADDSGQLSDIVVPPGEVTDNRDPVSKSEDVDKDKAAKKIPGVNTENATEQVKLDSLVATAVVSKSEHVDKDKAAKKIPVENTENATEQVKLDSLVATAVETDAIAAPAETVTSVAHSSTLDVKSAKIDVSTASSASSSSSSSSSSSKDGSKKRKLAENVTASELSKNSSPSSPLAAKVTSGGKQSRTKRGRLGFSVFEYSSRSQLPAEKSQGHLPVAEPKEEELKAENSILAAEPKLEESDIILGQFVNSVKASHLKTSAVVAPHFEDAKIFDGAPMSWGPPGSWKPSAGVADPYSRERFRCSRMSAGGGA